LSVPEGALLCQLFSAEICGYATLLRAAPQITGLLGTPSGTGGRQF